jgi:hypothetical protein
MLYFNPLTQIFLNGVWDILRYVPYCFYFRILQKRMIQMNILDLRGDVDV